MNPMVPPSVDVHEASVVNARVRQKTENTCAKISPAPAKRRETAPRVDQKTNMVPTVTSQCGADLSESTEGPEIV